LASFSVFFFLVPFLFSFQIFFSSLLGSPSFSLLFQFSLFLLFLPHHFPCFLLPCFSVSFLLPISVSLFLYFFLPSSSFILSSHLLSLLSFSFFVFFLSSSLSSLLLSYSARDFFLSCFICFFFLAEDSSTAWAYSEALRRLGGDGAAVQITVLDAKLGGVGGDAEQRSENGGNRDTGLSMKMMVMVTGRLGEVMAVAMN
jgi:hypothetical protein